VTTAFGSHTAAARQSGRFTAADGTASDVSALTLTQGFTLSLALLPVWSVELQGSGSFFTVQDSDVAFQSGTEGGYELQGATKVVVLNTGRVRGSLRGRLGYGKDYVVDIGPAIDQVHLATQREVSEVLEDIRSGRLDVNDPDVQEVLRQRLMAPVNDGLEAEDVVVGRQQRSLAGGVQLAAALHRAVGLTGNIELAQLSQESVRQGADGAPMELESSLLSAGALLSLDLRSVSALPVGMTVVYQHRRVLEGDLAPGLLHDVHIWGGGLYYTGREDLGLGVEATALLEEQYRSTSGGLRLWYYW